MKIKLSSFKLFRFFHRLVYGKNPANMSNTEKRKVVIETNLRWEDDGGPPVSDADKPSLQVEENNVSKKNVE